jgi:hypothetical protein
MSAPTEPAEDPLWSEPAEDSHLESEVVFVKTVVRKLRSLYHPPWNEDLTCQWYGGPSSPEWAGGGYYLSKEPLAIKDEDGEQVVVPAGSHFVIGLEEGKEIGGVAVGDYAHLICLDPRDDNKTLSFGYWHAIQDDQSTKFTKIENEMIVLAIAATGLAL